MVPAVVAGRLLLPAMGTAAAAAGTSGDLSFARFAPLVGSDFALRLDGRRTLTVTLADAALRAPHPLDRAGLAGESFSLLFAGHGSAAFVDGTFTLTHKALGAFPLFLAAVGPGGKGPRYEAIVGRRAPAPGSVA